jgi:hypothetical protein
VHEDFPLEGSRASAVGRMPEASMAAVASTEAAAMAVVDATR